MSTTAALEKPIDATQQEAKPLAWGERKRLPQRHTSGRLSFEARRDGAEPSKFEAGIGFYNDFTIGEAFLDSGKAGTEVAVIADEAAILFSLALQHGCPIETIRKAMPRTNDGRPEGAIGTLCDLLKKEGLAG